MNDGSGVFFKLMASSSEYDANDFESLPKLVGRLPEELFSLFKGAADETLLYILQTYRYINSRMKYSITIRCKKTVDEMFKKYTNL